VIKVSGNPLKKLPSDVVEQGTKSLIKYLEQNGIRYSCDELMNEKKKLITFLFNIVASDSEEPEEISGKDVDGMIIPGQAYVIEKGVKHAQEAYVGLELCTQNLFFDYSKFFYNKKGS